MVVGHFGWDTQFILRTPEASDESENVLPGSRMIELLCKALVNEAVLTESLHQVVTL